MKQVFLVKIKNTILDVRYPKFNRGISMAEVIVGASIISVSLMSIITAYNFYLKTAFKNTDIVKAGFLVEEGMEAARSLRDLDWNNLGSLTAGSDYYFYFNDVVWEATTTPQYIEGIFERSFNVEDVYRDANDDIASSGTLDTNTRKVTVNVSWYTGKATTTKSLSTYLTNIFND